MSNLQATVEETKATLTRTKDRMAHLLNETPDDRLNWSPSSTARTPIQLVAHAAHAVFNIHEMLDGRPFQIKGTEEAEVYFKEWESKFSTKEEVLGLLETNCSNYVAWLDGMTPEIFEGTAQGPFGMGPFPVSAGLGFPAAHMTGHVAQLEYIQTIYGDRDWHF